MKLLLKILFLLLTWFTNLVNATPLFTKDVLPNYGLPFSKTENSKEECFFKIDIQNFTRSGIEDRDQLMSVLERDRTKQKAIEANSNKLKELAPLIKQHSHTDNIFNPTLTY